ncbi:MAG: hypothetical protein WEC73_03560 [Chthoniobacterales bacterium]
MKTITILLTAIFGLTFSLQAGEEHDHGHSHGDIVIPEALPELRAEITAQQKKLTDALGARDASAAHAATDVLSVLVRAIPGKTQGLDEATLQRVTGMANNAAKAWGHTAHEAEHGDYEKAGRESAKAEASYRLLEARLPES